MDLTLAAVCDEASERPDGKLDLVGVFDELGAPGFPAVQDRMTVVFVLEWSADEAGRQPLRADLVDEQDRRVLTIQGHTDVAPAPESGVTRARTRLVMPLERVIFPHAGRYHFDLIAGGDVRRACSLLLRSVPGN
jgi:hypothetical protein